jgi:two-component system sensor histidine kinase ComP
MLDTHRHVMSEPLRNDFQETIEHLDLVHVNLREICFDLFPYTLEIAGLVHSLEQWLKKEQAHCEFAIRFLRPTESAHVQKWEEMETIHKQHLFRIVQELLHNARKHSHASEVCFLLSVEDERMRLHYSDNGAGLPQQVSVSTQRGAGLLQMKQRVKSMNGELVVESKAGAGLQVDIRIPL